MIHALLHPIQFRRDCQFSADHASEYLDGQLAPAASERMERHVSRCPKCRELLRSLRRTLEGLRDLRATESFTSGTAAASVLDALRNEASSGRASADPSDQVDENGARTDDDP